MSKVGKWFRPPRNLLISFVLVVGVPAATLIVLGIRLLDQNHVVAGKRQLDFLDHAADQGVRALDQDLKIQSKRLSEPRCGVDQVVGDVVCLDIRADRIEAFPPERMPYYPITRQLQEVSSEPFQEVETNEFREPVHLDKALAISRELAASPNPAVRAGALLREARILRKLGKTPEALGAWSELARISGVSINREPADLLARRTRCAIFEEQSRTDELRHDAAALAADLHAGKWQLDRSTFEDVDEKVHRWLDGQIPPQHDDNASFIASAAWLYEKWTAEFGRQSQSTGYQVLNSNTTMPTTIVWSIANGRAVALIAGPQYLKSHWIAQLQKAVDSERARVYLANASGEPSADALRVQRAAAETGLPWTIVVANAPGQVEPPEFQTQRRNLSVGLAVLLVLISAGSYFIWRAVNRELAVARLQSDFVSAVSHEFRTPLTTLRQFNELLADDDGPTPDKRRAYYQAQSRATERLHRLVESLLDFGRMEAGRRPYRFQSMDAAMLARDVTEDFARETNGSGFSVECSSDSGPHPVSADAEALSRALWNLLDNAVKYSGASRDVQVNVSRANGSVSIAVRDHGIGIPASEQKTVFQKFVRGAASTSGGIRGTGLGLAMVRHIVEAHGGAVNLQSVEGKGSTFTLVLPVSGANA